MAWGNPEQLRVEAQMIEVFERENPDLHVEIINTPGGTYGQKMLVMLTTDTAPDVMRVDHYGFPALVKKGFFRPIDDFVEAEGGEEFLADFYPPAIREGMHKGRLYGLNVLFGLRMIYYNKDLFRQRGVEDPYVTYKRGDWDFDAYLEAARKLTLFEDGRPVTYGTRLSGLDAWVYTWAFGGDIMNEDVTAALTETEPVYKAMEFMYDLRWRWRVAPVPTEESGAALQTFDFSTGRIGMVVGWSGEAPYYRKYAGFNFDIVPFPHGPEGQIAMVKGNQLVIWEGSKHPEAAWRFVKFVTGPYCELLLGKEMRRCMPTRMSVAHDPRYLDPAGAPPFQTDVLLDLYDFCHELPITDRWSEYSGAFGKHFGNIMANVGGPRPPGKARRGEEFDMDAFLIAREEFIRDQMAQAREEIDERLAENYWGFADER